MIQDIEKAIAPFQEELLNHSLYKKLKTPADLKTFMQHHVFAVWDFMSLLKSLQYDLTKVSTPWYPLGNPEVRYLINEIVLAEETDINLEGKRQSHFEMYLDAMQKSEASLEQINSFLSHITHGTDIFLVIAVSEIPDSVKEFLRFTFETISEGKPHKIAAAFTFGREDLIPDMFTQIIGNIMKNFPKEDLTLFKYYFDRHIELDGDEHGPMALKMIEELCGTDMMKWEEARQTAVTALKKRIILWNGIEKEINTKVTA
ncbi:MULTISPECIES: DUF3050 domain-containing protein [unclassified Leeuwenhoekiella]|uniref:DUF3050 domain-containing protein n=1 Tax=unclassified Leeuwenhoekiella TaxID=2615029 RepID=UPI0025BDB538|nr:MULTISPECIES: DUF3050 domain-containing protein [unclassified Leeuwenhoekiella]|tara:strand:+ start:52337 stop:53113 length:777 start_codon:yes stop_codon:yes gene_type:complete